MVDDAIKVHRVLGLGLLESAYQVTFRKSQVSVYQVLPCAMPMLTVVFNYATLQ